MMFISTLLIDTGMNPDRPRPGRLWLRNVYRVHQRLCMAFPSKVRKENDKEFLKPYSPDDFPESRHIADMKKEEIDEEKLKHVHAARDSESGFLFRIDPQPGGNVVILVLSAIQPDWDYAFHNAKYLLAAPPQEPKRLAVNITEGQMFYFRLMANPTRKVGTKSGPDGKRNNGQRVPVYNEQLFDWLSKKGQSNGFAIDKETVIYQTGYIYVNKKSDGKGLRMQSVRYDGKLKVTNTESFRQALAKGIGPGKAFGFGLLSIAPMK